MKKVFYISIIFSVVISISVDAQTQPKSQVTGTIAYVQGLEAFENREYQKSLELLVEARNQLGEEPGVSYAIADTYFAMDDLPNAALYGKQAVEQSPKNKWYRFKLAQIYRSAGENTATLEELNTLLEIYPNDYDALFMLADTYKDYGEYLKSNQVLNRALELTGPNRSVFLLKFRNFESLGIRDSAITQLELLRETDPDNLNTLNLLSEYYSRTGKDDSAKKVLNEALRRNARDPQSLINLAGIFIEDQKWDSAGALISTFLGDKVILPEEKLGVAQFIYTQQQESPLNEQLKKETGWALDTFTESSPEYGPAFTLSGQYYSQIGETEKALKKLERANELLPEDDIAWRLRLQLLLSENMLNEAKEAGIKADESVPDDSFIQFFLGTAYLLSDENEEAVKWLERASRAPARKPFKSVVYSTLGDAQSNLGNNEEADRVYELSLRYDPDNHNAMNNYAYNLSIRGVNLEKAQQLALKAIELDPENAAYLDTMGWVFYKLGEYEKAKRFIKASIDLNTDEASAEVLEHLGDVYDKLNNAGEAKKWWKKALEKDPSLTYLKEKIQE
ncbi:MAG: tetratricopeptide repeat protein [Balneola sp.]|nr:tetratricopeptide repeat protein [Balneola sp.]MBO6649675.1 tetratricopeptide repeat protein [Balneola sp.]MBO6712237.1 tetratricopeptide repeat protein [Balneola sp.]MBO6800431.1 tetratricopeptide repeat protein [Balneola sp.]MBO6871385.1 tetratricopeptide repeat protein [Balneola sp.]